MLHAEEQAELLCTAQQHSLDLLLDSRSFVKHSRGALPPRGCLVLIHLLLELRQQEMILAEPAAQCGVRQSSEAAIWVRALQSGDSAAGAVC